MYSQINYTHNFLLSFSNSSDLWHGGIFITLAQGGHCWYTLYFLFCLEAGKIQSETSYF